MGNFYLFCEVALRIIKQENEETGLQNFSSGSSYLVVIPPEIGRLKPGRSSRYGRDPTADTMWFIRKLRNVATFKEWISVVLLLSLKDPLLLTQNSGKLPERKLVTGFLLLRDAVLEDTSQVLLKSQLLRVLSVLRVVPYFCFIPKWSPNLTYLKK